MLHKDFHKGRMLSKDLNNFTPAYLLVYMLKFLALAMFYHIQQ
jgi:hypothetical protein